MLLNTYIDAETLKACTDSDVCTVYGGTFKTYCQGSDFKENELCATITAETNCKNGRL